MANEEGRAQAENLGTARAPNCGLEGLLLLRPGYKSLGTGYHRG